MKHITIVSFCIIVWAVSSDASLVQGADAPRSPCVDQLFDLSECELLELYRQGTCPPLLGGFLDGYSLNRAGKCFARPIAKAVHVVWKGKVFQPTQCKITNRWFGKLEFASAALGHGPSLRDGCPALIMDYRGRALIWGRQRDEVRQIGPDLYLGLAYREKKGCMHRVQIFALEGCACPLCTAGE